MDNLHREKITSIIRVSNQANIRFHICKNTSVKILTFYTLHRKQLVVGDSKMS